MSDICVIEVIEGDTLVLEVSGLGPQGPANILTIGAVSASGAASAVISGESPHQVLDLVLPMGPPGDPIDVSGLMALLGAATASQRIALADEIARLITGALPALPALPYAAGARLAAIGDSQIAYNSFQGTAVPAADAGASSLSLGFIHHAMAADPRFRFENWFDAADPLSRNVLGANQGVFGDHLSWDLPDTAFGGILGRLPALLSRRPDIVLLQGGTNTINSGDIVGGQQPATAVFTIAALNLGIALCRRAGIRVIVSTVYPRNDWPAGDARHQTLLDVNAWIRAQAGRDGVLAIMDPYAALAPANVFNSALFNADGVHLNVRGACIVGHEHLLPILRDAVAAGTFFNKDPALSNLLTAAQGQLQGTTGTKSGAVMPIGTVATGFALAYLRNASAIVGSKLVISGAIEAQVLDITPADTDAATPYGQAALTPPLVTSGLPIAGEWIRGAIHVDLDNVEAFSLARLQLAVRQGTTVRARTYGMNASSGSFATATLPGRSFWIITEPLLLPAGVPFDRLYSALDIYWDKTKPAFKLKLSRLILRKVEDPRPGWGY